jgi:hypothetical protein
MKFEGTNGLKILVFEEESSGFRGWIGSTLYCDFCNQADSVEELKQRTRATLTGYLLLGDLKLTPFSDYWHFENLNSIRFNIQYIILDEKSGKFSIETEEFVFDKANFIKET